MIVTIMPINAVNNSAASQLVRLLHIDVAAEQHILIEG
jgi:hypothetical protein